MQCPSCGTDIKAGQKFCMECGVPLHRAADPRAATTSAAQAPPTRPMTVGASRQADDPTRPLVVPRRETGQGATPDPFAPPTGGRGDPRPAVTAHRELSADPTVEMTPRRSAATTAPMAVVSTDPTPSRMADTGELPVTSYRSPDHRRRFRLRPLAMIAVLALAAAAVAVFTPLIEITAENAALPDAGTWRVNDLGTNNAVAGLLAAATMVMGAVAWCFGFRWGAGLAGGAGAALAGWAALVVGLAELPVTRAEAIGAPAVIERPYGYWVLIAAGGLGLLTLIASLAASGRAGRSGLDPWIAALGAVSFLLAAGGPLLPEGTADWTGNYDDATLQMEVPTLFFVGRAVQLGLLALCGVVGFLLVRRWGLGLAIGGAVAAGWLLVTAATQQTAAPIGPGYANPASPEAFDLQPHAVTVVGFAMVGFFALVAIVVALLDSAR